MEGGPFTVGERVLVPHNDNKNYEAKVLKAEYRQAEGDQPAQWYYFLHYNGWNKKYDEWVPQSVLFKLTDALPGEVPQARAPKKMQNTKFGKKKVIGEMPAMGEGGILGPLLQLELDIPHNLKKALLEDYDAVVQDTKMVPLPRSPTVIELLQAYVAHAAKLRGVSDVEEELVHGLRTYFDKALVAVLLFRSERLQALTLLADGRLPSAVYGGEHLLRLFVKLPDLLPPGGMNEVQLGALAAKLQDFLAWFSAHVDAYILPKDRYLEPEPLPA